MLAFGRGPYATDAQHVSVEFVHPVIVRKRALPALDLSILFRPWLEAILHPEDIVMGFGPPEGDPDVWATLQLAHRQDAMTFALPGIEGSYALDAPTQDPFMHQEMIEILYHTLWETVHVFFEHRELGHEVVCPSSYDLGEDLRVVLLSVTEGEDKPLKYPPIFNSPDVAIVTKSDLAEAVEFDGEATRRNIQAVRPGMRVFQLSAKTGEGMEEYLGFLAERLAESRTVVAV